MRRLLAGFGASVLVASGGWRTGSLTGKGAVAATLVGTSVCAGASWPGVLCLGTFFLSSSRLSKSRRAPDVAARGSRRDAVQVFANGGAASVAALLARENEALALAVTSGSLAAATADTWATEIGSSSGAIPRQLVSGRRVQPGESGGVTWQGSAASAGGALLIAAIAGISGRRWMRNRTALRISAPVFLAGVAGSLVDSLAGELVQERRYCEQCVVLTEKRVHGCGHPTVRVAGVRWITNDTVNAFCTVTGALVAWGGYRTFEG